MLQLLDTNHHRSKGLEVTCEEMKERGGPIETDVAKGEGK